MPPIAFFFFICNIFKIKRCKENTPLVLSLFSFFPRGGQGTQRLNSFHCATQPGPQIKFRWPWCVGSLKQHVSFEEKQYILALCRCAPQHSDSCTLACAEYVCIKHSDVSYRSAVVMNFIILVSWTYWMCHDEECNDIHMTSWHIIHSVMDSLDESSLQCHGLV